jgi:hypothetical protein
MFPFNQPEKTKDCGYRCLYYVINPNSNYEQWLHQFRFFSPIKSGITFTDICTVLSYYNIDYKFTQLTEEGTFIIYSGTWLKHGHYFIYKDGEVYCSTKTKPEKTTLAEVVSKLEAKTVDGAFRCLKINLV